MSKNKHNQIGILTNNSLVDNIVSATNNTYESFSGNGEVEVYELQGITYQQERDMLIFIILMKLILLFIVSAFLWPHIMPKLFSGVTEKPGFLNIVGLSVLMSLLLS